MDKTFRRADPADAPELARIHVSAWQQAYRGIVPDSTLEQFTVESRTERFRAFLTEGAAETYIVEIGKTAVGFLTLGASRDTDLDSSEAGEIWGIYIQPDFWRKGFGRQLCEQGQKLLASRGFTVAVLWVLEANEPAKRFYEAMGFVADGAAKQLPFGIPLTALRYRKTLKRIRR